MTIPAHDSVAYLPARPRLALLRKEADQLISLCSRGVANGRVARVWLVS